MVPQAPGELLGFLFNLLKPYGVIVLLNKADIFMGISIFILLSAKFVEQFRFTWNGIKR
jgi:hypothetical protein